MAEGKTVETSVPDFEFDLGGLEVLTGTDPQVKVDEPVIPEKKEPEKIVEEPKAPVKAQEPNKAPEKPVSSQDPMVSGIYNVMVERGYFTKDEEFKGTFEELDSKFEKLPELVFDAVVSQLPETARNLLTFSLAKGENLKDEDLLELFNQIKGGEVVIDTPEAQEMFLKQALLKEGQSQDDADELISVWKEKGRLEDRAKFYKTKEERTRQDIASQKIEQAKVEKQQQAENAKKLKDTIKQELDKTTWDATRKNRVLEEIFTGKMNAKSRAISANPTAVYQLADFMTYFDEKKGTFDLDAYMKRAATPAVKSIKENLERHFSTTPFSQSREVVEKKESTEDFEFVN